MALKKDAIMNKKPQQEQPVTAAAGMAAAEKAAAEKKKKDEQREKHEKTRRDTLDRKNMKQFAIYLDKSVFESIRRYAGFRAIQNPEREDSTLQGCVNIAIREFMQKHQAELDAMDALAAKIPND